jgi:AcrR family transcriptional regulator
MAGRPRSVECDRAIQDATLYEYATRGLEGMSVDAVAARAGVSKATIYRRYPSKIELIVDAALVIADETAPKVDTGTLRGDLTNSLRNLQHLLDDPILGAVTRMLVVDAIQNEELARMHTEFVAHRRAATREQLRRAITRGELQPDIDLERAMDSLAGPIFYRHLVSRKPVDDEYIDAHVDDFIARYGVRQPA